MKKLLEYAEQVVDKAQKDLDLAIKYPLTGYPST